MTNEELEIRIASLKKYEVSVVGTFKDTQTIMAKSKEEAELIMTKDIHMYSNVELEVDSIYSEERED